MTELPSLPLALSKDLNYYISHLALKPDKFWIKYQNLEEQLPNQSDKLEFNIHTQQAVVSELSEHLKTCRYPEGPKYYECDHNKGYSLGLIILKKTEESLSGLSTAKEDTISVNDFAIFNEKIDSLIDEINTVRLGQDILFTKIEEDINELRSLFFLGKKKWNQLAVGKITDALSSGLIAESAVKPLIELASNSAL